MKKIVPEDSVLIPQQAVKAFGGQIFDVYQWSQTMFDDSEATFEMLKRPDTVTVMCVVDDKVLVIDEQQPHVGERRSFPGGRVDPTDLSVEAAISREVLEETGYSFNNWRLVKVWQPHNKMEWFIYLFLAWDVASKIEPNLDVGEKITVQNLSFNELKELVINKSGYLGESTTIFEDLDNLDQLLALPEFKGKVIDV
ncbi:MAG: NUDIX domain-containing protein [Patescibacteria group bacterium]